MEQHPRPRSLALGRVLGRSDREVSLRAVTYGVHTGQRNGDRAINMEIPIGDMFPLVRDIYENTQHLAWEVHTHPS